MNFESTTIKTNNQNSSTNLTTINKSPPQLQSDYYAGSRYQKPPQFPQKGESFHSNFRENNSSRYDHM